MADDHLPTLKRGDENDEVVGLQQKLAAAGFALALAANGHFDASTAAAVGRFPGQPRPQRRRDLRSSHLGRTARGRLVARRSKSVLEPAHAAGRRRR